MSAGQDLPSEITPSHDSRKAIDRPKTAAGSNNMPYSAVESNRLERNKCRRSPPKRDTRFGPTGRFIGAGVYHRWPWQPSLITLIVGLCRHCHRGQLASGPENRVVDLKQEIGWGVLVLSVLGSFFASRRGRMGGGQDRRHPTQRTGHAARRGWSWLATIPMFLRCSRGSGGQLVRRLAGAGLAGNMSAAAAPFDKPEPPPANASAEAQTRFAAEQAEYHAQLKEWRDDTPKAVRISALGVASALLLGLIGAVIGGWMASGEPMTLGYHRTRLTTNGDTCQWPLR